MALLYPGSAVQVSRVIAADRALRSLTAARVPAAATTRGVRWEGTARQLACAAVLLNMVISANLLYALGISYTAPGGSPFAKFHPATYLVMLAFALVLWQRRAPLATWQEYWHREPAIMGFMLCISWCVVLAFIANGPSGTAVYIESFAPATILLL